MGTIYFRSWQPGSIVCDTVTHRGPGEKAHITALIA